MLRLPDSTGKGLPDDTIVINCKGAGGQSFGAFIPKGLTLNLTGDSNDYFGKGLSGGKLIVIVPPKKLPINQKKISSSVTLLFMVQPVVMPLSMVLPVNVSAVRNSGAYAVVEGVGEHGCEYMTGGRVVVLGQNRQELCSRYERRYCLCTGCKIISLYKNINKSMISIEKVENKYDSIRTS